MTTNRNRPWGSPGKAPKEVVQYLGRMSPLVYNILGALRAVGSSPYTSRSCAKPVLVAPLIYLPAALNNPHLRGGVLLVFPLLPEVHRHWLFRAVADPIALH
jgi:hypothetical protein